MARASGPPFFQAHTADRTSVDVPALLTIDAAGRIVMVNAAAGRLFGCAPADLLGADVARFLLQGDPDPPEEPAGDAPSPARLAVGLRADGERLAVGIRRCDVETLHGAGGGACTTLLLRDAGWASGPRFTLSSQIRGIVDLAPTAIWITDGDRIVFANRACAALFGETDADALVGRSIYALLQPDSRQTMRQTIAHTLSQTRPAAPVSEHIARADGSTREVEIALAALPDHGSTTLQMVISDVTERARSQRELQASRRDLQRFAADLVEAREQERRRFAREMHDELGQRLSALKLALAALEEATRGAVPHPAVPEAVSAMATMIDDTTAAVRRIAADLRPAMLDDLGLGPAIEWLVGEWRRNTGIAVELRLDGQLPPLGDSALTGLYRIVQEALTNIARHAHATEVRIGLACRDDHVELTVRDNGVGLNPALMRGDGHGLIGMRERCHMLGGRMTLRNRRSGGVRLTVVLPRVASASDDAPGDLDGLALARTTPGEVNGED